MTRLNRSPRTEAIIRRAILLVATLGLFLPLAAAPRQSLPGRTGTSVTILVDFSRSVVPLATPDERALKALTAAISDLAGGSWTPPIKISWAAISSSSLAKLPAFNDGPCEPLEFEQKLIKAEKAMDKPALKNRLSKCVDQIKAASAIASNWTQWTDISGAIRLATESARDAAGEKILVIYSDFREDLPPGTKAVPIKLYGEQVLLINRPGTDDNKATVSEYLERINHWTDDLKGHGASQAHNIPVFGATQARLINSLNVRQRQVGTAVLVLVNSTDSIQPGSLRPIAAGLAQMARDWAPPVTVTWVGLEQSAFLARWIAPIEFSPTLIKRPDAISFEDLGLRLDQCAAGMERLRVSGSTADLSGALALGWTANQTEAHKVLIVVSDFRDDTRLAKNPSFQLNNVSVVMVGSTSSADVSNQADYFSHLDSWEKTFRERHSPFVCRTQLENLTSNTVVKCLSKGPTTER
jgi:hypothetical protein